jgi:hypothetical protein
MIGIIGNLFDHLATLKCIFLYSILSLWFWMNGGYQWFIVVIGGSTLIEDLSLEEKNHPMTTR